MHNSPNHSSIPARRFILLTLILIGITGCDGGGGTSLPVINVPPVTSNSCNAIMDFDTAIVVPLSASDSNGNGTIASYTIDTLPTNGSINGCVTAGAGCTQLCATVSQCASFTYTPNQISNRRGMDKFDFHVTDSGGLSSSMATAWILNNGKVRIMPLGDSITAGVTAFPNPPDAQRVGYRRPLYDQLEALSPNYAVNFVGGLSFGLSANPPIADPDHEGHGGFCAGPNGNNPTYCTTTAGNLADNVITWLDANPADIILLHAGTNAFTTSPSDMDILLDRIEIWQASNYPVTVFVARIVEYVDDSANVQLFNNNVATMINGRSNVRYVLVDQQIGAGLIYTIGPADGLPTGSDMADNLHPNQDGYNKMAAKWLSDLTNLANVGPKFVGLPQCP